jgi:hypothetical protein
VNEQRRLSSHIGPAISYFKGKDRSDKLARS